MNTVEKLKNNPFYKGVYEQAAGRLTQEEADEIWEKAAIKYDLLCIKYTNDSQMKKLHTEGVIFAGIAIYSALLEKHPNEAMLIMELGTKEYGLKKGKQYRAITSGMFGKSLFMFIFPRVTMMFFGKRAGFETTSIKCDEDHFQFDVSRCPYNDYCTAEGASELTHIFCDGDEFCYGNLKDITFTREGTLGRGNDCCDFLFEREDTCTEEYSTYKAVSAVIAIPVILSALKSLMRRIFRK